MGARPPARIRNGGRQIKRMIGVNFKRIEMHSRVIGNLGPLPIKKINRGALNVSIFIPKKNR